MKNAYTIIVLFLGFFNSMVGQTETEPNDNPTQANQIFLNIGQTGNLIGTDVNDWFLLNVPQGGILTLTIVKTGTGNARLYLKDAEIAGFPEITNLYLGFNDSPATGWTITYPLLSGNYYLHLELYSATVNYILTPTLSLSNYPQDLEPNNTLAEAQNMPVNGTVSGTLRYYGAGEGTDIVDWFKMTVPQAGILHLNIHKKGPGNTYIRFLDGEKTDLPEISPFYTGYGESPPDGWNWSYPVLAGTYYFKVLDGESYIDYKMVASLTLPNYAEDIEPNNNFQEAQTLSVNGRVSGTLRYYGAGEGADLQDWFKLTLPQGGILNFTIHKKGPGNTYIRLRDGEKADLPEISNFYTGYSESPPEGWKWSYPALAGTYYLQVEGGEFQLDYQIANTLVPSPWGEDTEPNNDVASAQSFPLGDSIGGLLGYYDPGLDYDNWDWFKMTTNENGLLSFNVTKQGVNNGNLRLRNATEEIATHYLIFGDWTTTFSKIVPAGTYFLGFEKYSGDFQYKVRSSLLPAPIANFTYAQTGNVFTFENTSINDASYFWDFDDGTTATTDNGYHEYAEPGNFNVCLIATNVAGADTTCHIVTMPGVARALPAEGGNSGDVTVQVFGGGLDTNYVAKIMNGTTVVATSDFTGFAGKSSIFVRFDLRDKPVGNYQLRIEAAGGPSYSVPGGFKIVQGIAADPWVSIGGRNRILFNTWTTYTINYGNKGNVDSRMTPVWLAFSKDPGLQVEFVGAELLDWDTLGGEQLDEGIFVELDSLFGQPNPSRIYPLLIPIIEAGSTHSMKIRVKTSGNLEINVWAEKPWFGSPINANKLACVGEALAEAPPELNIADKVECTKLLTVLVFTRIMEIYWEDEHYHPLSSVKPKFFTTLIRSLHTAIKVCGVTNPKEREKISDWVMTTIINRFVTKTKTPFFTTLVVDERGGESCPIAFAPQNPTTSTVTAVSSLDPNEKAGPSGYGLQNYMRASAGFPYTIFYENKASATAPAHTVTVTDQLDTATFDLKSFGFGNVFIGDSTIYVPPGLKSFSLDIELSDLNVITRVQANLDTITGKIEWLFRSLDPITLEDVEDPDIGFLPPNVNKPEGEGAVTFFVKLKHSPRHNEKVKNTASIVFDANPAIITNEHLVTFDLIAPGSSVDSLVSVPGTEQLRVQWSGSDDGSGLKSYYIYHIRNNSDTVLWLGATTETAGVFTGQAGSRYGFYSVAVDNSGNVEAPPTHPDAVVTISGTEDGNKLVTDLYVYPNPASDQMTIINRGIRQGCLTLMQTDGQVVMRLYLQAQSSHQVNVSGVPEGLLQWFWATDCSVSTHSGRVMVVR